MLITEIAAKFPQWSRTTVAEVWLRDFARETDPVDVKCEWGFEANESNEYSLTPDQAEAVWSHDWPHGL